MDRSRKTICTDAMAQKIAHALVEDLSLGHQYNGDPRAWQMRYTPLDGGDFKRHYQICELLKKYTFEKDVYTRTEVVEMSKVKFLENQHRLDSLEMNLDNLVRDALFRTKGWIDRLLGDYDLDEHLRLCYWPKKASVGVPQRKATLENRWLTVISGSVQHNEWFDHIYLPWFGHASDIRSTLDVVDVEHLSAVLVEKTYKSLRMIVPNTSTGGLYSNGLGAVMIERLHKAGYEIKGKNSLPELHRRLAKQASVDGRHATVDQRMASDNITVALVLRSFPMRWAKALLYGRIGWLDVEGELIETKTMSTMGIGFTFPMQMVLFLGLAEACRDIWEDEHGPLPEGSVISVFGDDLICPTELKTLIVHVFESLGLIFNHEKTFWAGPFRESCGGDYFRGSDVRPAYLPPGGFLTGRCYEAWLYKSYNALIRRWDKESIPQTLDLILNELRRIVPLKRGVLCVPFSYGDDAGLKTNYQDIQKLGLRQPHRDIHGTLSFMILRKEVHNHRVNFHDVYMWERFRASVSYTSMDRSHHWDLKLGKRPSSGTYTECQTPVFAAVGQAGEAVVPLKRTFVVVERRETNSADVVVSSQQRFYDSPQRFALKSDRTKKAVKVYAGVSLDTGDAAYETHSTTNFCWL